MPQDACHAKSSTKLLKLNNRIVLAHIADSKRHDSGDSNIVQCFPLDTFPFRSDKRPPHDFCKLQFANNVKINFSFSVLSNTQVPQHQSTLTK